MNAFMGVIPVTICKRQRILIFVDIVLQGLFYAFACAGYLFLVEITFSPRVWGYQDYPRAVKERVPPQTRREKTLAAVIGLPWLVFFLGFPLVSTYMLKIQLGGDISLIVAFLNSFTLFSFFNIVDLVLLDWLVISKITPNFVIIPGTQARDYKNLSEHYRGHIWGIVGMALLSLVFAVTVSVF